MEFPSSRLKGNSVERSEKVSENQNLNMSATNFFELGYRMSRNTFSNSIIIGDRAFRSFFGTGPDTCEIIWSLLAGFHPTNSKPIYLLWTLLFLKQYNCDTVNSAIAEVDPKTFRKWVGIYMKLMREEIHLVI